MVANIEEVQGYAAALQHDSEREKGISQGEGGAMKKHIPKVQGELMEQIESCRSFGIRDIRDTLFKHA